MASSAQLAVAAVAVHAVLFVSIFDIYFTSPVERGLVPQGHTMQPPARRLVLIVADGLRADTLYSPSPDGGTWAPFLRRVIENEGRWGVSHTHVPTESRPGHVALIAGLYEDVSAVTRGWQENPVEFDSVFNESHHTWSWGSPDILPMFARGAVPGRVETFTYDAAWEDFADSDASKLDTWVFERVEQLFERAENDQNLAQMLSEDKIIFFLHLLGIDTNGHAHRPTSREVIENLQLVDRGVERMVNVIKSFYKDNDTAFVFTSDHGMTNWGSHGAGLPDETMTPLVAWGAGIKSPLSSSYSRVVYHDTLSEWWGLEHLERVDVEQADIAPLVATLIGVPVPVNSEGVLPLGYIHYNSAFSAESLLANAQQLTEQLHIKEERTRASSLPLMFRPFPKLRHTDTDLPHQIRNFIQKRHFEHAIELSYELISLAKEGIQYYHTYHRFTLKLVITLGFIGWVMCILVVIAEESSTTSNQRADQNTPLVLPSALYSCVALLLFFQSSPLMYYLYYSIPIISWSYLISKRATIVAAWKFSQQSSARLFAGVSTVLLTLGVLELLCLSFFFRQVLSLLLLLLSIWPYFTPLSTKSFKLCVMWTACCGLLAVFPLLPVVGRSTNYIFVILSGIIAAVAAAYLLSDSQMNYLLTQPTQRYCSSSLLLKCQLILLSIAAFIPGLTGWYFAQKASIPGLVHGFSWFTLAFSIITPHFGTQSLPGRLLHFGAAFYTIFILLSLTFEAVFFLLLCVALYLWLAAEELLASRGSKVCSLWESVVVFSHPRVVTLIASEARREAAVTLEDVRRVGFCVFFGILSFFGIGNIASVNTFDPATVYSFLTVFSPFVMGSLILLKMAIPFISVSGVFNAVMTVLGRPLKGGLLLMLIMSDLMGLNFFFLVRDHGSWLEIGISISHYVIMMTMIIGIVVLMVLARLFTGVAVVPRKFEDLHLC